MTCLSIIQTVFSELGLTPPNSAVGSSDSQVSNIVALCNREGNLLAARYDWTALQTEATFTTLAQEDQGAIETIAPGYKYILNDTIWNRTLRRPVFGPRTPQSWQQQKAFAINGPWSSHRIKAGHIFMFPVPSAGEDCYFEYISKNWCTDSTGATGYSAWNNDADIPVLDENLLILGTIWRWKKLKGFEYAEDFADYERLVLDTFAKDGGRDWLSLTNTKYDIQPGIVVPSGSWNL
jgi:hypothetical protein